MKVGTALTVALGVAVFAEGAGGWFPQGETGVPGVAQAYAAMLADSRCSGIGAAGARGRDLIVVREAVAPARQWWWNAFPHPDFLREIPTWLPGIAPATVQSFSTRTESLSDLDTNLPDIGGVQMISRREVDALSADGNFWPRFYKRHPSATGLIEVSQLGLRRDGREALGYCARTSESLSGHGFLVLLRVDNERWRAIAWRQVWES